MITPFSGRGLRMLIGSQRDLEVVGEASDGDEAVRKVATLRPDVALVDISMPGSSGIKAIERIREASPATRVLVLTMHDMPAYLRAALAAGASGYVVKRAADSALLAAIRDVHRGRPALDPALAASVVQSGLRRRGTAGTSPTTPLSQREREVLELVAQGYTNQQIADHLGLSVKTVETYRARLVEKLGLQSRAELVRYALDSGLFGGEAGPTAVRALQGRSAAFPDTERASTTSEAAPLSLPFLGDANALGRAHRCVGDARPRGLSAPASARAPPTPSRPGRSRPQRGSPRSSFLARLIIALSPTFSETYYDEALTGLMSLAILRGIPQVFYWGQPYLAALDAYLAAAAFYLFGPSTLVLRLGVVWVSVFWVWAAWRIGRRIAGERWGLLAGLQIALPPIFLTFVQLSSHAEGVALALGTLTLAATVRLLDPLPQRQEWSAWILLGVAAGLGWWTSQMSTMLIAAAAIGLLVARPGGPGRGGPLRRPRSLHPGRHLPFWLWNVHHEWATFHHLVTWGGPLPGYGERIHNAEGTLFEALVGGAYWDSRAAPLGPWARALGWLVLATVYVPAAGLAVARVVVWVQRFVRRERPWHESARRGRAGLLAHGGRPAVHVVRHVGSHALLPDLLRPPAPARGGDARAGGPAGTRRAHDRDRPRGGADHLQPDRRTSPSSGLERKIRFGPSMPPSPR